MKRKKAENVNYISDLMSDLEEDLIEEIEFKNIGNISSGRVKDLALKKRKDYKEEDNIKKVPRKSFSKVALIVAILSLFTATVYAANKVDFFKNIFSGGVEVIEDSIVTPIVSEEKDGKKLSVEAMVTDGYNTNIIVSVEGVKGIMMKDINEKEDRIFDISSNVDVFSTGYSEMYDFSDNYKKYYNIELLNQNKFDNAKITISLNSKIAPITVSTELNNELGNAVFNFLENIKSKEVYLKELQVSPMGFLLIGNEDKVKGGLPSTEVELLFKDGKKEKLEVEFDSDTDGKTVSGGGGVIMDDSPNAPLVTSFYGVRNPENEIVIRGGFSRIIDPKNIEKVIINNEIKSYQ